MSGYEDGVSWSDRPRGGWDEYTAAKARGKAKGAEDVVRARLEAIWALPANGPPPGPTGTEGTDPRLSGR